MSQEQANVKSADGTECIPESAIRGDCRKGMALISRDQYEAAGTWHPMAEHDCRGAQERGVLVAKGDDL